MAESENKDEIKLVRVDPNLKSYEQLSQKDKVLNPDSRLNLVEMRAGQEVRVDSSEKRESSVDKRLQNIDYKAKDE